MSDPILLIPMCGVGKRFKEKGYKDHKAIININGKNMIEKIQNNFPISIEVYIITTKSIYNSVYPALANKGKTKEIKFIFIEEHKLGPGYTLFKAKDMIPSERPIFISYCDITWSCDKKIIEKALKNSVAAIFTHKGFHPHLVNNSFSAFCKVDKKKNTLIKIKEKGSFTNNWMEESLSIGLFYIKNIEIIKKSLVELINPSKKVSNEYYPSLIFNILIENNIQVDLYNVNYFVHYGTPEQLEDFISWINFFKNVKAYNNKEEVLYESLILASGSGSRMKGISNLQKPLIKLANKKLINYVIDYLPISKDLCSIVFNQNIDKKFTRELSKKIIYIKETKSQLDTLLNIKNYLKNMEKLFICSCDCFGKFPNKYLNEVIDENDYEIICFGFKPSLMQQKLGGHTYFEYHNNTLKNVFIKNKFNPDDLGLAGFFWFKRGKLVSEIAQYLVKEKNKIQRELIIDDVIKYSVSEGLKVGYVQLEDYKHLGTYEEFNEFEYWEKASKALT
tara:strand:- start:4593 stop:6107 length:1515 start_codon:yes stop_codon:yes gene_type:complete